MTFKSFSLTLLVMLLSSTAIFSQWNTNLLGPGGLIRTDAVHFLDDNTGYICGTNQLFQGNGIISRTTDGGGSWNSVGTLTNAPFLDIQFANPNLGIAVGAEGQISRTTDGGNSWNVQTYLNPNSGSYEVLNSVHFADASTVYIAGGYFEMIVLKSTDGGGNWTRLTLPSYFQRLKSVYFTDPNTGYIGGGDQFSGGVGRIYQTTDGGLNWDTLSTGVTNYFNDIYFTDSNNGVIGCVNDGLILKTSNAGQTWTQVANPAGTSAIGEFSFYDTNNGYACTLGGKIVKTTDGGSTWTLNGDVSNIILSLYSISVPSAAFGLTAGASAVYAQLGTVIGTTDPVFQGDFSIAPNPSQGEFTLYDHSSVLLSKTVSLFDLQGRKVFSDIMEGWSMGIDLLTLAPGSYIVVLESKEGRMVKKLIISQQ